MLKQYKRYAPDTFFLELRSGQGHIDPQNSDTLWLQGLFTHQIGTLTSNNIENMLQLGNSVSE